jgi:hypothetical protein
LKRGGGESVLRRRVSRQRRGGRRNRLTRREEGRDCDCGIVLSSVSLCDALRLGPPLSLDSILNNAQIQKAVQKVAKSPVVCRIENPNSESNPAGGIQKTRQTEKRRNL